MNSPQDRTEEATPRRRAKALAQGSSAKSAAASAALTITLAAIVSITALSSAPGWIDFLRHAAMQAPRSIRDPLSAVRSDVTVATPLALELLAAAGAVAAISAIGAALACGSLGIASAATSARLSRAAPSMKRIATVGGIAQAALAMIFTTAIATGFLSAGVTIVESARLLPRALTGASILVAALLRFWWLVAAAATLIAAVDVAVQRRRHAASLRMTPREVRDERAEHEGKPEVRARRRSLRQRRARGLRLRAIATATAVIANPQHVAIALRYAPPDIDVPIVVSRGAELAAVAVRASAAFYGVPVVESADLARELYARVDVDDRIPEETYAAVAAIFAWLIRTNGSLRGRESA